MQLIDIDRYDSVNRPYGALIPGEKTKIPVVIASTVTKYPDSRKGTVFFDTMCTDGHRPVNDHMAPNINVYVPSRTTDGGGDKSSWSRSDSMFEASGYVSLTNTRFSVTNAWMAKSGRKDEPENTHVRDHVWNVHLHGMVEQHFNTNSQVKLMLEHDRQFRYEYDYLWRVSRRPGDIRKVPILVAEVEGMHLQAVYLPSQEAQCDTLDICVPTQEGPLRFGVKYPLSSLPSTELCGMDASLGVFYGADNMFTITMNRLSMTAMIYSLMKNHGMSRMSAFKYVGITIYDLYPVMKDGFYTFDNPCLYPPEANGSDRLWDKKRYRLYGEPLFDGTASQTDIELFKHYTGTTWDYLHDIQAMFALDKPIEDHFWWGGSAYPPTWRQTTKTCAILCRFLSKQEDIEWNHEDPIGESGLKDVDWSLSWRNWDPKRDNRTDFRLLKRLGVVPFLPRISPQAKTFKNWEWLSTVRRRLYPACVVVWDKLEHQASEVAKLSKMVGEDIDPKELKQALSFDAIQSGRPESAVFMLGAMEFTKLKRADAEKNIQGYLQGTYVALN